MGTIVKRKARPKSAFITEQQDIFDGAASVLRTHASGDVWQFRMWVTEERKYVRKTLKTRDLQTALARAKTLYLQLYSDVASGKKLFGISLGELVAQYIAWRQQDVEGGAITAGRLVTITSQLKHLKAYKGEATLVSELDRQSLYDYAQGRRVFSAKVKDVTIRNEQVTINHMMRFAFRQGSAHFDKFDFAPLRIREVSRRDTFTLDEYDRLFRYLRKWSQQESLSQMAREERRMIRDCILLGSNTMLRVGELWQLRWGDVQGYKATVDNTGRPITVVTLKVRPETAKNRKTRLITTRGGEFLKRRAEGTTWQGPQDLVFCGASGSVRYPRRKFYNAWKELMEGLGLDYKKRNLTWYSLRHFGITCRLRAGASMFDIAKIVGTSPTYIDQHYGHFDQAMSESVARKSFSITKEGISFNSEV